MPYYLGLSILSTSQRQGLSAEARRILSQFEGRPLADHDIAREKQGRPFFPACMVDFNVTHSGFLAAVSYVKGENLRTGCDTERVRPRVNAPEIAKTFFAAPEQNYITPQGGFNEARFYAIWTLKECFLKLRGLSVFDMVSCPSFIDAHGEFAVSAAVSSPLSFYLYELSGNPAERYMLATAIEGAEQPPPEIRWFSQSFLTCRMIAEIKVAPNPAATVRPKM